MWGCFCHDPVTEPQLEELKIAFRQEREAREAAFVPQGLCAKLPALQTKAQPLPQETSSALEVGLGAGKGRWQLSPAGRAKNCQLPASK